ncbi:9167_t:CDS:2, partial [Acaulospora colombiana]
ANDRYGNVIRRWWQTAEKLVACKLLETPQTQKFLDQLVLLNKLNSCSTWQDDPLLRPGLYKMFLDLELLHRKNPRDGELKPLKYNDDDEVIAVFPEVESNIGVIEDDLFGPNTKILFPVRPILKFQVFKLDVREKEQCISVYSALA